MSSVAAVTYVRAPYEEQKANLCRTNECGCVNTDVTVMFEHGWMCPEDWQVLMACLMHSLGMTDEANCYSCYCDREAAAHEDWIDYDESIVGRQQVWA